MKTYYLNETLKYPNHRQIFTDGSKINEKVGCAAVQGDHIKSCRLPNDASIHSAELWAIKLALEIISAENDHKFLICSDSSSAIQTIMDRETNNPLATSIINTVDYLKSIVKDHHSMDP